MKNDDFSAVKEKKLLLNMTSNDKFRQSLFFLFVAVTIASLINAKLFP